MAYLKINDIDFSMYVKELKVTNSVNYNAQTNANGDTVVDYINKKRVIDITIIPLTQDRAKTVLQEVDKFNVSLSFLNPNTGLLKIISFTASWFVLELVIFKICNKIIHFFIDYCKKKIYNRIW